MKEIVCLLVLGFWVGNAVADFVVPLTIRPVAEFLEAARFKGTEEEVPLAKTKVQIDGESFPVDVGVVHFNDGDRNSQDEALKKALNAPFCRGEVTGFATYFVEHEFAKLIVRGNKERTGKITGHTVRLKDAKGKTFVQYLPCL